MLLPAQQRVTWTPDSSSRTQDTARGTGSAHGLCQKVGVQREGSVDTGCARIASLAPTASQARPVSLSSADTQLFHVKKKSLPISSHSTYQKREGQRGLVKV